MMGCISDISLMGSGIINIMLASVLECTREIGIRRALGARRRDLPSQFLVEAVMVSLLGLVLGYYPARQAASLNPIDALRRE